MTATATTQYTFDAPAATGPPGLLFPVDAHASSLGSALFPVTTHIAPFATGFLRADLTWDAVGDLAFSFPLVSWSHDP